MVVTPAPPVGHGAPPHSGPWTSRIRGVADAPLDAGLGTSLPIRPGTRLTAEGSTGSEFFIIDAGHVAVQRLGIEVAVLGPGDHFGEIVMLDPRSRRTATVVAAEDLTVKVFNRREFGTLWAGTRPSPSRSGGTPGAPPGGLIHESEDLVESVGVDPKDQNSGSGYSGSSPLVKARIPWTRSVWTTERQCSSIMIAIACSTGSPCPF